MIIVGSVVRVLSNIMIWVILNSMISFVKAPGMIARTCTPAWITPATTVDDPRSEVKVVLISVVRARLGLKETLDEVGAPTTSSVSLLLQ